MSPAPDVELHDIPSSESQVVPCKRVNMTKPAVATKKVFLQQRTRTINILTVNHY